MVSRNYVRYVHQGKYRWMKLSKSERARVAKLHHLMFKTKWPITIKVRVRAGAVVQRPRARPDYFKYRLKGYGLSLEEYVDLFFACDGRCMICRVPGLPLGVDHDHSTGKVRGLLCLNCNAGLGMFLDSTTILESARTYIQATL